MRVHAEGEVLTSPCLSTTVRSNPKDFAASIVRFPPLLARVHMRTALTDDQ